MQVANKRYIIKKNEDTKRIISSLKLKEDRQYNDHKKRNKHRQYNGHKKRNKHRQYNGHKI